MTVNITERKRKRCTAILLDYHDADGQRHQLVVGKASSPEALAVIKREAIVKAKQIELDLVKGTHRPNMGEELLDAAFLEFDSYLEASTRRAGTRELYRNGVKVFRRFLKTTRATRLRDVTPDLVVKFVQERRAVRAPSTVNENVKVLHAVFARFVRRGLIAANPFSHADVKDVTPSAEKHERCPTDDEFQAVMDRADGDYRGLFLLLGESGLRINEALHLRWCDLHFGQDDVNWLRVEPHGGWEPKTKSSVRTVPISPRVEAMLRARLSGMARLTPTERIFPCLLTPERVRDKFNAILCGCNLHEKDGMGQKLRVHSLRHYYATRLVRSGADPASVRDLLGHTSISVTNRYFNVPRGELFRAVSGAFGVTENVTDSTRLYTFPQDAVRNRQETAISQAVVSQAIAAV